MSLENLVRNAKTMKHIYKIPENLKLKCSSKKSKILLLNAPCNGFGDLIFAKKLSDYLKSTFKVSVTIATTEPEKLLTLGEKKENLKKLASTGGSLKKVKACRVFKKLEMYDLNSKKRASTDNYDLYFVAPLSFDYEPELSDVRPLVPNATKLNTYFFSEYNDSLRKDFDFHVGVGKGRDGILLTKPHKFASKQDISKLTKTSKYGKYALIYIADIDFAKSCVKGFLELVLKKYTNESKFQIVCPTHVFEIIKHDLKKLLKDCKYATINFIDKEGKVNAEHFEDGTGTLTIRGDILPVKNEVMMGLIKYSVKDILLTGDQSISDALSCCVDKNIFYQIAPWKVDFGKNMAKELPNKYLKSTRTSCGNLSAIKYNSNYRKFVKTQDFFANAYSRLKSIICFSRDKSKKLREFVDIVNSSNSVKKIKEKFFKDNSKKSSPRKHPRKHLRKGSRKHSRKGSRKRSRKGSRKRSRKGSRRKGSRKY